jgi:hypothetical protein
MANHLGERHAVLDTFGADVTLKSGRCKVLSISVFADTEIGMAVFIDNKGNRVAMVGGVISSVEQFTPCQPIGCEGFIFDDSASTLDAADFVIVHFA